jgi:hypothetical protein
VSTKESTTGEILASLIPISSIIYYLHVDVSSLKGIETELDIMAQKSGANADRLVGIIEENDQLQAKVKSNLEAQVMISILTAVLQSDTDEDFMLSKSEMRRLEYRLSLLPGIILDKGAYRKFVHNKEELHLHDIMVSPDLFLKCDF